MPERLSEVVAVLLDDPSVHDCALLVRSGPRTGGELVAYVVPADGFLSEAAHARLQTFLPHALLPGAYVPVSTLPLTADGLLDEAALLRLPVIDADLMRRWEDRLRSLPGIDQVAVVAHEQEEHVPPFHLADLMPRWRGSSPDGQGVGTRLACTQELPERDSTGPKRLAISHGEPLSDEADASSTLADAVRRAALAIPARGLTYLEADDAEATQSYAELLWEAQRILGGLRSHGVQPGDPVICQLALGRDFIPAFWGCVLGGFVPVPVPVAPTYEQANNAVSKLQNVWQMLGMPMVVSDASRAPAIRSITQRLQLQGFRLATIDTLRTAEPDSRWHPSRPDDLALLLLTSGSTGTPKLVMQTHRSLLSQLAGSARLNGFGSGEVSLNWFPLDHVGGLVMFHLRDVYLSCQQIQAPTEAVLQRPLKWLDWIDRYRATVSWAPNFAYALINAQAEALAPGRWDLSCMRFLLNGGEAIVTQQARRFLELLAPYGLPSTAMHPAWGMSETCSGVTYSHRFTRRSTKDEDAFVEVGEPIPGFSMRIVDGQDRLEAEGTIGSLQVKGAPVTPGYYENPEANRGAFTDNGWFKTGDLGFLRQGRLTITGREKDVIIINGLNHYSHEIEAVVEELDGVAASYTAAVAVRPGGAATDKLAIVFSASREDTALKARLVADIRQRILESLGVNPEYVIPVARERVPKTAIGKIERARLREQFEAGELAAVLERTDVQQANANTLPRWFYRTRWRRRQAPLLAEMPRAGRTLVFVDRAGLGSYLCGRLESAGWSCVRVERGAAFVRVGPHHFRVAAGEPEHYRRLFASLGEGALPIEQVLHLWDYDGTSEAAGSSRALEAAQEAGVYSLLCLVQALIGIQGATKRVRLWRVTSRAQWTSAADEVACEKAPASGLLKTIPRELPWWTCRQIDLPPDGAEIDGARILRELRVHEGDEEVAYRAGERLVARLEPVDLSKEPANRSPLEREGLYLISGGLGGIGGRLAGWLLSTYAARLLLVGRTPLPERGAWQGHLAATGDLSRRLKTYLALEELPGAVAYEAVDVCDGAGLQLAVERAEGRWGRRLAGIFHLAGVLQERLLMQLTREELAAALQPKVLGSWALHELLARRGGGLFVSFSSVNGFFGGAGVGAYAAANCFLDAFALQQAHRTPVRGRSLAWSQWADTGMARGHHSEELTRARGYHALTPSQGLRSVEAALTRGDGPLLVGLDGRNAQIRRRVEAPCRALLGLTAYYSGAEDAVPAERLESALVLDRFGTRSTCSLVQMDALPLMDGGAVDRTRLGATMEQRATTRGDESISVTEAARRIAEVWKEILDLPEIGLQENFFDLGGHSLLMAQVQGRLRTIFGRELTMVELFRHPTLHSLATYVSSPPAEDGATRATKSAAAVRGARQASMAQQRRLRQPRASPKGPER